MQLGKVKVIKLDANCRREPVYDWGRRIGSRDGSGDCEVSVMGPVADALRVLSEFAAFRGSAVEWATVTLTVEGSEKAVMRIAERVHAVMRKPIADGSSADGKDG
jgi:hypothetical protein